MRAPWSRHPDGAGVKPPLGDDGSPPSESSLLGLEVHNLSVNYGYGNVVRNVGFGVKPGEVLAILGANGAGKTSLLRAVVGAVRSEGHVRLNGQEVNNLTLYRRARLGIRYLPDDRGLFPALSVADHLWLASPSRRRPDKSALEQTWEVFPHLAVRTSQSARSMSGGEQQMLSLAMALASEPGYLLVDEPSVGLAPALVKNLFSVLRDIASERNVGVLLVEQFAAQALSVADRGVVLSRGEVVMADTGVALLEAEQEMREAYL